MKDLDLVTKRLRQRAENNWNVFNLNKNSKIDLILSLDIFRLSDLRWIYRLLDRTGSNSIRVKRIDKVVTKSSRVTN